MHRSRLLMITVTILLLASLGWAQSAAAMYQEAQRIFKSYRYQVDYADFQLKTYVEDGKTILQLLVVLNSGRNRFDEALLVGFAASGAAISKTGSEVDRVSVVVKVQYKDEVSIAAIADTQDVVRLFKDEIDVAEFMARVTWY